MGYDYDTTIAKLEQFKAEKEGLLEDLLASDHYDFAKTIQQSITGYNDTIAKCKRIRDQQSTKGA